MYEERILTPAREGNKEARQEGGPGKGPLATEAANAGRPCLKASRVGQGTLRRWRPRLRNNLRLWSAGTTCLANSHHLWGAARGFDEQQFIR